MACFSLNATKNLSGGEGGFLNTDNEEYWEKAKMIRTFGEKVLQETEKIRPYYSYTIGWNYRTQELPAAFARSQLKRMPRYNAIARRNGEYLTQELGKIPGLIPPYVLSGRTTIYHKYSHSQHIVDRFLDGYGWEGRHHRPAMDIVSLYVDQVRENDLSRERAQRHPQMKIYPTIAAGDSRKAQASCPWTAFC